MTITRIGCEYLSLCISTQLKHDTAISTYVQAATLKQINWRNAEDYILMRGWSGGAMVLGKLPVPGRPTILITVGQGPIALAVGAGGGGLDIFTLICPFSSFSLSLGDGPI